MGKIQFKLGQSSFRHWLGQMELFGKRARINSHKQITYCPGGRDDLGRLIYGK